MGRTRPGAGTGVRLLWSRAVDDPGLAALDGVIEIELEYSPNCGGKLKIITAMLEQPVIEMIVRHLGLQARAPPGAPARGQAPQVAFTRGQASRSGGAAPSRRQSLRHIGGRHFRFSAGCRIPLSRSRRKSAQSRCPRTGRSGSGTRRRCRSSGRSSRTNLQGPPTSARLPGGRSECARG